MASRLLRRVLQALLPHEHRAVVVAHLDAEASTWQMVASVPGAIRLRLRAAGRGVWDDIRQGGRQVRRHPGFALAVTLTLGLGVAATNAVTTLGHAVLLRPLPFVDADRIITIEEMDRSREATSGNVSWPDFLEYQAKQASLEAMAGHTGGSRTLHLDGADAARVPIASVTGEFFDVLGVRPLLGRLIAKEDMGDGANLAVVLSHTSWRTRFAADPAIVGRVITMNGQRVPVVGVLPPDFEFPPRGLAELWLPVRPSPAQLQRKYFHWMDTIARLRPGISVRQAETDLDGIARGFAAEDPKYHATSGARAARLRDRMVREAKPIVVVLSLAGMLVLVVAATNVAGLLLSRGIARRAEMGVRDALGAARWRLVRQLLVENLVLAAPGIILGLAVGHWAVRAFVGAMPRMARVSLPHLGALTLDLTALPLSLGVVLAVVAVCSLLPALRTTGDMRFGGRGVVGPNRKTHWVLVGAQVALAVTLLSGAGLMVQSVRRLLDVSPGFQTRGLLTFTINLSGPTTDATRLFFERLTGDLAALPGVDGVTNIDQLPLTGRGNSGVFTTVGDTAGREQTTLVRSVAVDYFDVMGISLERGRAFAATDAPGAPRVVMINRRLADSGFEGDPVGRQITFPFTGPAPLVIVGVVGDERFDSIDQPIRPVVYFPDTQSVSGGRSFIVRTAVEPATMVSSIRRRVAELDPALPVFAVATMEDIAGASEAVFRRRAVMTLLLGFAVAAVVLAAIGVYGVLAQLVADRTREIGVRMALGARPAAVTITVLRQGVLASGAGLLAGLGGSLLLGRALGALLFGTAPADVVTLLLVAGVIVAAVIVAAILPARRALRIDPMEALRTDG